MGARLIMTWLGNCVALLVAAAIIPAIGYGHDVGTLLLAGLALGIVNFALRPVVIVLTLPAVILSLGLALLLVNALMLWVTSKLVSGFQVGDFGSTVGAALVIWLVNLVLRQLMHGHREQRDRRRVRKVGWRIR